MTFFTFKYPSTEEDRQTLIDIIAQRPPERITDYPSIVDLQEILGGVPELEETVAIWQQANEGVAGFTILNESDLQFDLLPTAVGDKLASQMIGWAVTHIRNRAKPGQTELTITTSCIDNNIARLTLLKQLGFEAKPGFTWKYQRSLADPIPEPQLPDGFIIRPLAGEQEVAAHVQMHRAAFGTEHMTVEYRQRMMKTPDYLPELDLVAVAPNGQLAAYTMCQISEQENALSGRKEGATDPVATHPDYQRLGLAKALILTGLKLLQQRGMKTAQLGTWHTNVAMQKTATAVGFEQVAKVLFYKKVISP